MAEDHLELFLTESSLTLEDREWQVFWRKMILPEKSDLFESEPKKKIIVLAGPTGVGKTALSLIIAQAIGGEIISADSMQVYRGMDIGTAKATREERAVIPHHLIDVRDLDEMFNVIDFWEEATRQIEEITARGHVPIVVGGTGFYLQALLSGPPSGPPSVPGLRLRLEEELGEKGSQVLFERLRDLDPDYAQTITQNDKHKIVRGLEIISLTNRKVSDFTRRSVGSLKYDARCWFLHMPKEVLYQRIEKRCDEMIERGLLNEVRQLEKQGLRGNSSASQAIGYRQALAFLDSSQSGQDWQDFVSSFKTASRRYAKRQFTWFRKEALFRWLNREEVSFERAAEIILQDFELSF